MTDLKQWRAVAGYTQAQAAAMLGVKLDAYRSYERGDRSPATVGRLVSLISAARVFCPEALESETTSTAWVRSCGLTVAALAALFGIGRSTAHRYIADGWHGVPATVGRIIAIMGALRDAQSPLYHQTLADARREVKLSKKRRPAACHT